MSPQYDLDESDEAENASDLVQAQMILMGGTRMQPTIAHLRAIEEHYECRIIQIVKDIEVVKRKALNGR